MESSQLYDEEYYEQHTGEPVRSARVVLGHLWKYLQPNSVADVGCGRGAWLKVCRELGSKVLLGLDGEWNSPSQMIDSAIQFKGTDLNRPFSLDRRVDLAMSLEVAEHLDPSSARQFIQSLTQTSDAILFSAAFSGQGGVNHLNEQLHTYWSKLFGDMGYAPFDLFRPALWGSQQVDFWYRQNTFLYCKKATQPFDKITAAGCHHLTETSFMDCVHPVLYDLRRRTIDIGFKEHMRDICPSFYRAIQRRLARTRTAPFEKSQVSGNGIKPE